MAFERGGGWGPVLLVAGAVAFGVILAGALDWTPAGWGAPGGDPDAVAVRTGRGALPGFADLAEAAAPAGVTIRAVSFQEAPQGRRGAPQEDGGGTAGAAGGNPNDPFFDFFFGPPHRNQPGPDRGTESPERRSEAG